MVFCTVSNLGHEHIAVRLSLVLAGSIATPRYLLPVEQGLNYPISVTGQFLGVFPFGPSSDWSAETSPAVSMFVDSPGMSWDDHTECWDNRTKMDSV